MKVKRIFHSILSRFMKLSLLSKAIVFVCAYFIFLSSAMIVLSANGIEVIDLIMDYDESGMSRRFPDPTPVHQEEIATITTQQVIDEINNKRKSKGLAELTNDFSLSHAASLRADDMMEKDYYDNTSPDGKYWSDFLVEAGYNYEYAGSLLAQGYTSVFEIVSGWESDTATNKDMYATNNNDIGVAVKKGNYQGGESTLVVVYVGNKIQQTTQTRNTQQTTQATQSNQDPIVTCNFQYLGTKQLPKSQCSVSFECQINSQWYIYTDRNKCKQDQEAFYKSKYSGGSYTYPTYAPIPTIAYPSYTYQPQSTTPLPTSAPDNTEFCNAYKAEWQSFKEQFYATDYNNFSSSTQAIYALEGYRQSHQSQFSSSGCPGTLSLY